MRCALDLIAEQMIVEKRVKEEQERLRKEDYKKLEKNTIQFCETIIADALNLQASSGKTIRCSFRFTAGEQNSYGNRVYCPLALSDIKYADGADSYSIEWGTRINLDILQEYLEQFCFEVLRTNISYNYYGWGRGLSGVLITVSVPDILPCEITL